LADSALAGRNGVVDGSGNSIALGAGWSSNRANISLNSDNAENELPPRALAALSEADSPELSAVSGRGSALPRPKEIPDRISTLPGEVLPDEA
jgi:hypothetical protein